MQKSRKNLTKYYLFDQISGATWKSPIFVLIVGLSLGIFCQIRNRFTLFAAKNMSESAEVWIVFLLRNFG